MKAVLAGTLAVLVLTLSGCLETGPEEYDRVCRGAGYAPGTSAYNNCWEQARQRRLAGAAALMGAGAGLMSTPQPVPSAPTNRQIVDVNGRTYTCQSYDGRTNCIPLRR